MRSGAHAMRWKMVAPLALMLGGAMLPGMAQSGSLGTQTTNSTSSSDVHRYSNGSALPNLDADLFPGDSPSVRVLRQNARRDDIKKRMQQNAQRLLLLTAELRADLLTREPTEADGKRLDDIARLAHAVREQMKQ